jgi:ketosteroid isomerase-like protein
MTDHLAIAERLFAAVAGGDVAAVRALYAPDVRVWHNVDGITQSADENLVVLQWVTTHIRGLRYDDVRRQATADGFVQQHVLRGTVGDGVAVEIPACIVATIRAGRITQLDEYLDSKHTKVLLSQVRA